MGIMSKMKPASMHTVLDTELNKAHTPAQKTALIEEIRQEKEVMVAGNAYQDVLLKNMGNDNGIRRETLTGAQLDAQIAAQEFAARRAVAEGDAEMRALELANLKDLMAHKARMGKASLTPPEHFAPSASVDLTKDPAAPPSGVTPPPVPPVPPAAGTPAGQAAAPPATGAPTGTFPGQVVNAVGGPHRQAFVAGDQHEKHPIFDIHNKIIGYTTVRTSLKATPNPATYHPAL